MSPVDDLILQELRAAVMREKPVARSEKPVVHPIDVWVRASRRRAIVTPSNARPFLTFLSLIPWILGASAVIVGLLYVSRYGLRIKGRVITSGGAAIQHLLSAKDDLERLDFDSAQEKFTSAESAFGLAQRDLEILGPGLTSVAAKMPGLGMLSTGRTLIVAGRAVADAGRVVTDAISAVARASNLLDAASREYQPLNKVLTPLQDALIRAGRDIDNVQKEIASVDSSVVPPEMRKQFADVKSRLPHLKDIVDRASAGVTFLTQLVGIDRPRTYLLLFQNSSELRPTGGFPGSYGLITLENGRVKDLRADDVYNPDGQIKDLIVPPLQLQHITPSWGMRDANWFIDFPTSARKVAELYRRGGGVAVDGVIAIRPDIVSNILRVTGPISLAEHDVVLNADNFISTIQSEIEDVRTSRQPKQIIMDMVPSLAQRLAGLPPMSWMQVVRVFQDGLSSRDVMLSLADRQMEQYVENQGWDGRVADTKNDYLMINISNIKGAKADAVTDTVAKIESWLDGGTMAHRLTLTRQHNGGNSPYPFYNKTNYSYVRILVPNGSTLRGIVGNDRPTNKPIMDYSRLQAFYDPDLQALERTYRYDGALDVTIAEESGKTEFGFWMRADPGKTEHVQLEYAVPSRFVSSDYRLFVQRQPGLDLSDLEFTLQKGGIRGIGAAQISLTEWPDSWRLHDKLKRDLELSVQLR